MKTDRKKRAGWWSWALFGVFLYLAFFAIDDWAAKVFVRPAMASALVTALQIGVFLALVCLASPLSKLLGNVLLRRKRR